MESILLVIGVVALLLITVSLYYYCSVKQANYPQLTILPRAVAGQRILICAPHPDDETISAGAFIYCALQQGAIVRIVLATDGNQLGLKCIRYREFRRSTSRLKVPDEQLSFLGLKDTRLSHYQKELINDFVLEINEFNPDIIICPHPADYHPDHKCLGITIKRLLESGMLKQGIGYYTYLTHYPFWPTLGFLAYQHHLLPPHSLFTRYDWFSFPVDGEAVQAKTEAVANYRSQWLNPLLAPKFHRLLQHNELFACPKKNL